MANTQLQTITQQKPDAETQRALIQSTADIVTAMIDNGESKDVKKMIREIYYELSGLSSESETEAAAHRRKPAVPVDQSVQDDHIICLEDGQKLKMLKRYLKTHYNMTPEEYRIRWGLPSNYPMVAPEYAKKRSKLAREIGLGKKSATSAKRSSAATSSRKSRQQKPRQQQQTRQTARRSTR